MENIYFIVWFFIILGFLIWLVLWFDKFIENEKKANYEKIFLLEKTLKQLENMDKNILLELKNTKTEIKKWNVRTSYVIKDIKTEKIISYLRTQNWDFLDNEQIDFIKKENWNNVKIEYLIKN
jgi:hypothetical protein